MIAGSDATGSYRSLYVVIVRYILGVGCFCLGSRGEKAWAEFMIFYTRKRFTIAEVPC